MNKNNFITFHGTNEVALNGTDTLRSVANFIAVAERGNKSRRDRLLTREMKTFIFKDGENIAVAYFQFCDQLGLRTNQNGVLMRRIEPKTFIRRVRKDIHGLRKAGLDVSADFGGHDVMLLITKSFKENDSVIPDFFRERSNPPSFADILADGQMISQKGRAA